MSLPDDNIYTLASTVKRLEKLVADLHITVVAQDERIQTLEARARCKHDWVQTDAVGLEMICRLCETVKR